MQKTAITTPFSSFLFHCLTFGLKNSGAPFQRMMDNILGHLSFAVVYIDDILVFSDNEQDHQGHLQAVLSVLQENELVARQDKCVFVTSFVEFLGHVIGADGIQSTQNKVKAITGYPTPTTIKDQKAFLGLVNFYGRFIPMVSHIMASLNQVIAGKPRKLTWDTAQQAAFDRVKRPLATATTRAFSHPEGSLSITTDASDMAIGAVLQTHYRESTCPLAFFNKTLQPAQRVTAPSAVNSSLPVRPYVISGTWSRVSHSTCTQITGHLYQLLLRPQMLGLNVSSQQSLKQELPSNTFPVT